jgi:hypothetical protein
VKKILRERVPSWTRLHPPCTVLDREDDPRRAPNLGKRSHGNPSLPGVPLSFEGVLACH